MSKDEKKEPVVKINRDRYSSGRSASGTKSLNNGDEVAALLDGMTIDELYSVTKKFVNEDFRSRYEKLNVGMQRMNLGNRIRGHVRAIDAANEKAENPGASGLDTLSDVCAPIRGKIEARAKKKAEEAEAKKKEREAKAKAKADKKADAKAKGSKKGKAAA